MKVLTPFENLICLGNRELSWKDRVFYLPRETKVGKGSQLEMDDHSEIIFVGYTLD